MASMNTRASLIRQSTPKPQSPNREENLPTKDPVEKESKIEDVFSAVSVANEIHYDEKIIHYAITGENPNVAENVNSSNKEAVKDSLDGNREREYPIDLNQEPPAEENFQGPRRSSRERRINSHLRGYALKF